MKTGIFRHDGRSLPVYPISEVAWGSKAIKAKAREPEAQDFIRGVRVDPWVTFNLNILLKTADRVFEEVARACGATVVDHVWGLAQTPLALRYRYYNDDAYYSHRSLPLGMSLVAQVALAPNITNLHNLSDERYATLSSRINDAVHTHRQESSYVWTDGHPDQFMAVTAPDAAQPEELILTDIEPFVLRREDDDVGFLVRNEAHVY